MTTTTTIPTTPYRIADETYLIPNLVPAGPDVYLAVNSVVIRGEQPIVVDTGAPIHREHTLEHIFTCWTRKPGARVTSAASRVVLSLRM